MGWLEIFGEYENKIIGRKKGIIYQGLVVNGTKWSKSAKN